MTMAAVQTGASSRAQLGAARGEHERSSRQLLEQTPAPRGTRASCLRPVPERNVRARQAQREAAPRGVGIEAPARSCDSRCSTSRLGQHVPIEQARLAGAARELLQQQADRCARTPSTRCAAADRRAPRRAGRRSRRRRVAAAVRAAARAVAAAAGPGRRGRGYTRQRVSMCTQVHARNKRAGIARLDAKRSSATQPRRCVGDAEAQHLRSPPLATSTGPAACSRYLSSISKRVRLRRRCQAAILNSARSPANTGAAPDELDRRAEQVVVAVVHHARGRGPSAGTSARSRGSRRSSASRAASRTPSRRRRRRSVSAGCRCGGASARSECASAPWRRRAHDGGPAFERSERRRAAWR